MAISIFAIASKILFIFPVNPAARTDDAMDAPD
jgi:hypothetical protein